MFWSLPLSFQNMGPVFIHLDFPSGVVNDDGELIVVVSPPARFSDSRGCDEYTEVAEEEPDYVTPPCSASLA